MIKYSDQKFMQRAIELAKHGLGIIDNAPIFGYVIVRQGIIILENWNRIYEYQDLNNKIIKNNLLLSESIIYLTLEPCIYDNTIFFLDFILKYKIPKVVIGIRNPCNATNGLGIRLLKLSGVEVIENVLKDKCYELNKRFFTFYQKKRPFIILQWTQSLNGIICNNIRNKNTGNQKYYQQLTEKWRKEETGFLIDSNTILSNHLLLQSKYWYGKEPIIIILDQHLIIPYYHFIYNNHYKIIIFTEKTQSNTKNINFFTLKFNNNLLNKIINKLYEERIQSIIIEASKKTIEYFIQKNFWDEAKIFIYNIYLNYGIQAPKIIGNTISKISFLNEQIIFIKSKL